jgi:hypothetical protein
MKTISRGLLGFVVKSITAIPKEPDRKIVGIGVSVK